MNERFTMAACGLCGRFDGHWIGVCISPDERRRCWHDGCRWEKGRSGVEQSGRRARVGGCGGFFASRTLGDWCRVGSREGPPIARTRSRWLTFREMGACPNRRGMVGWRALRSGTSAVAVARNGRKGYLSNDECLGVGNVPCQRPRPPS